MLTNLHELQKRLMKTPQQKVKFSGEKPVQILFTNLKYINLFSFN